MYKQSAVLLIKEVSIFHLGPVVLLPLPPYWRVVALDPGLDVGALLLARLDHARRVRGVRAAQVEVVRALDTVGVSGEQLYFVPGGGSVYCVMT